jgi:hypothetical protein
MTLRIEKCSNGRYTLLRLTGRVRSEHVEELKAQIGDAGSPVALDLEGVMLVDVDVIRFLGACEADGVQVLHCSPYIREWMAREQGKEE